jgi:hypothetical protein
MATYPEGEEKFAPRWAKKIRRVPGRTERKTMRLSCNLILNNGVGKPSTWYSAGEAIFDERVPDHAKPYRISEREGRELYREICEWRAMVAERQAKKKREEAERKRGSARASKA